MDLFYIPPNSGQQIWEELEQSIDLALNSNHAIIITGDFNINQLDNNPPSKRSTLSLR
jgi:exonuclease III